MLKNVCAIYTAYYMYTSLYGEIYSSTQGCIWYPWTADYQFELLADYQFELLTDLYDCTFIVAGFVTTVPPLCGIVSPLL